MQYVNIGSILVGLFFLCTINAGAQLPKFLPSSRIRTDIVTSGEARHAALCHDRAVASLRAHICDCGTVSENIFSDGFMSWLEASRTHMITELDFALLDRNGDNRVSSCEYVFGPITNASQTTEDQLEYIAILMLDQAFGHRREWAQAFHRDHAVQSTWYFDILGDFRGWWILTADNGGPLTAQEVFENFDDYLNSMGEIDSLRDACGDCPE